MSQSEPLLPRRNMRTFPGPGLLWRTGAIFVTAGVIAGAFGAHSLRGRPGMTPDKIAAFKTASEYAVFNGLALLLVSMHPRFAFHPFAGPAIAAGGLLFSGSIFALTLNSKLKPLGPVTPLGGVCLIAGYLSLAI
ncbi:uncharacterized protein EV420DRAFT_1513301 [Desarmillaria tabescens]|uniref:DUF423-domain-containing protein n=1 Tax=Armillaria tabescens TaxID=1929756 RepID=A0AA39MF67_ARMTA|nr:uncharacterized protein EV420DRAFT_1611350 [Desarmillaria tabescens]XP_060336251.1 uncharacterized protein EV420DRAFT_1513301 [Desarmillaria tabescens]KAK0431255.1 hypothetical protein EV420DRAFT_1611350 [Desarmillaria tabescens]KAK0465203.1 hypothetical protein EV420DRAFT_1513301 [Desarmillaria tabescens]